MLCYDLLTAMPDPSDENPAWFVAAVKVRALFQRLGLRYVEDRR